MILRGRLSAQAFLRRQKPIGHAKLPEFLSRNVRVWFRQYLEQPSTAASKSASSNKDTPTWNRAKSGRPALYQLWIAPVSIFSAQPAALHRFPATPQGRRPYSASFLTRRARCVPQFQLSTRPDAVTRRMLDNFPMPLFRQNDYK